MTLPNLASTSTNQSGTAVTTATFTRPAAAATGDLLIAVLNCDVATGGTQAALTALGFKDWMVLDYADGRIIVCHRRAAAGDPASWAVTLGTATAYQASMLAYRNAVWVQDRASVIKASSLTITGVPDLDAYGPNYDVLPVHIIAMDQEAAARVVTPGAGHTSVFDSAEPTTFLRTIVMHGAELDVDANPIPAINETLSVAEAHAIVAYTLAGVALPSTPLVADGYGPAVLAEPNPFSTKINIVSDPPSAAGGALVPITGQLWPRGVG